MTSRHSNQYAARARASRAIRHGVVAAAVAIARATMGLVFLTASHLGGLGMLQGILVVVLIGLTYGLLRRSRACAVALSAVLLFEAIAGAYYTPSVIGLLINLLLLGFVVRATVGTFEHARLMRATLTPVSAAPDA